MLGVCFWSFVDAVFVVHFLFRVYVINFVVFLQNLPNLGELARLELNVAIRTGLVLSEADWLVWCRLALFRLVWGPPFG